MLAEKIAQWEDEFFQKGKLAGKTEGWNAGELSGLAKGILFQRQTILDMLADRFADVPQSWIESLNDINNGEILKQLARAVYKVKTPGEFGSLLTDAINRGQCGN